MKFSHLSTIALAGFVFFFFASPTGVFAATQAEANASLSAAIAAVMGPGENYGDLTNEEKEAVNKALADALADSPQSYHESLFKTSLDATGATSENGGVSDLSFTTAVNSELATGAISDAAGDAVPDDPNAESTADFAAKKGKKAASTPSPPGQGGSTGEPVTPAGGDNDDGTPPQVSDDDMCGCCVPCPPGDC